jgi:hypothetical protein
VKERLVTLGLAIAALLLCYALFLPKPPPEDLAPPRPLSTDAGAAGYLAAWRWLNADHVPVMALRDRFDHLPRAVAVDAAGNVMLTTLPHKLPVRPNEAPLLDAWIERGNTLVVAAALDDTPQWALEGDARLVKDAGRLTRLKFETVESKEQKDQKDQNAKDRAVAIADGLKSAFKALSDPRTVEIEPRGAHPLLQGIHALRVISDLPAARWHATPMDSAGVLQIAQVRDGGAAAIWVRRQGKGQVIVLGVAGLFSNQNIGSADNAALLANIIGSSLKPGGSVIFDDAHQGAVDYYDAKAFYADPRLHRTLGWLVLLWFVFVLGLQRLGVQASGRHGPDITAFVGSSGDFLAATLTPAAAGARLLSNFFNSIHRRLGTREDGSPTWEWLASQAGISHADVVALQELQTRVQKGGRVNLSRLQNQLSQLQEKII